MLYDALSHYTSQDICPMHMPGHKRNTGLLGSRLPYAIDITEIDGFDNLHQAQGILEETAQAASALYKSKRTFPLVNGSTAGILAAIRAAVNRGDKIIMARNCHRSVYNAAELCCLQTVYLAPEPDEETGIEGSIAPEQITSALGEHPDTKLVVITSPTYTGIISDIQTSSAAAHKQGIPLLVDQAHGAHLGFSDLFPGEALKNGADLVITSIHKTLPALTQCALAHVGGDLIDGDAVARELAVFQTSSPSYVLMASIDHCVRLLAERSTELFSFYEHNLKEFDNAVKALGKLKVLCHGSDTLSQHNRFFRFDPGKIVILTGNTNLTGMDLTGLLRKQYHIELEMAGAEYAIAMTSICDTTGNFTRLADALLEIDRAAEVSCGRYKPEAAHQLPLQELSICDALQLDGQFLPVEESAGAMALEYVWAYPPGIPLIVPGERIGPDLIEHMKRLTSAKIELNGSKGKVPQFVYAKQRGGF